MTVHSAPGTLWVQVPVCSEFEWTRALVVVWTLDWLTVFNVCRCAAVLFRATRTRTDFRLRHCAGRVGVLRLVLVLGAVLRMTPGEVVVA